MKHPGMKPREFLRIQAERNGHVFTCSLGTAKCGLCAYHEVCAKVARNLLRLKRLPPRTVKVWASKTDKAWKKTKFCKLWVSEERAGRKPEKAFTQKGWRP